jgi:hypothetical protein
VRLRLINKICRYTIPFALIFGNNAFAFNIFGHAPDNEILLGMWTAHISGGTNHDRAANNTVGLVYKSFFAATFTNTYSRQSVAAGLERMWVTQQINTHTTLSLGYRLGLMYGYDKRLMRLAGQTPILPFAQLLADFSYRRVGLEISYTGIVISAGFYILI